MTIAWWQSCHAFLRVFKSSVAIFSFFIVHGRPTAARYPGGCVPTFSPDFPPSNRCYLIIHPRCISKNPSQPSSVGLFTSMRDTCTKSYITFLCYPVLKRALLRAKLEGYYQQTCFWDEDDTREIDIFGTPSVKQRFTAATRP